MNNLATLLAYWVHDLDPYAIRFSEDFGIRWYGLAYALGAIIAIFVLRHWAGRGRLPIRKDRVAEFILVVFVFMVVGARLGYVLLYQFDRFLADPGYLFAISEGGMSSHGGAVGLLLGVAAYSCLARVGYWVMMDGVAAVTPIGIVFGRIGNFINGELWGRPADVPWAVIFPRAPLIDGEMVPRHPSQLYAAGLEGLLLLAVALIVHRRHRKPGVTLGVVLTGYAVVRFINEFWREPDVGQPIYFDWMSKGQLYSLPVLVLGVVILIWAARRPARPEAYAVPADPTAGTGSGSDKRGPESDS